MKLRIVFLTRKVFTFFRSVAGVGTLFERPEDGCAAGLHLDASILGIASIAGAIQPYAARSVGLGLVDIRRTEHSRKVAGSGVGSSQESFGVRLHEGMVAMGGGAENRGRHQRGEGGLHGKGRRWRHLRRSLSQILASQHALHGLEHVATEPLHQLLHIAAPSVGEHPH